jgi:hypothetical protein
MTASSRLKHLHGNHWRAAGNAFGIEWQKALGVASGGLIRAQYLAGEEGFEPSIP